MSAMDWGWPDDDWGMHPDYDDFESDVDVQCKFCKRRGFHWGKHYDAQGRESWRIYTASGRLHDCRPKPSADAFDVVPE